jgi:hypothetical protein
MIGVYIVTGLILIGAMLMVVFSHHRFFKMTSSTSGEVVRSEQREVRDENERRDETVVVVRYAVHGKPYEIERVMRGRLADRLAPGKKVVIRYNPAEPDMADLAL